MPRPFVGRDREQAELRALFSEVAEGNGSVALLAGEPGIGKSRLLEELGRDASRQGMLCVWGRASEVGGAPAYWPWLQVLRAILAVRDPASIVALLGHRGPMIAQILPELSVHFDEPPPSLEPAQARFMLFDAVATLLVNFTHEEPLLVLLEDLHMADPSSLALLTFVGRQLRTSRWLCVGSFRDSDAERGELASHLTELSQLGPLIELGRFDERDVTRFLEETSGKPVDPERARAIFALTEGNPLFVAEAARSSVSPELGSMGSTIDVPGRIRHAIRQRLERVSSRTREVLRVAGVLGRSFDERSLEFLLDSADAERAAKSAAPLSLGTLREALAEATIAALVNETLPGSYEFSHILVREVLHRELDTGDRKRLHLLLAERLQEVGEAFTPPSELAHHFLEAGIPGRERAVEALRVAGRRAQEQLAFGEASRAFARAIEVLDQVPEVSQQQRLELLLELGASQIQGGQVEDGQAACFAAAELSRSLGDAPAFARAALACGRVFVFAHVDARLVRLLREALVELGKGEPVLRVQVMARLAAAMQPAPNPEDPIRLAREAVIEARALGDERVLLLVLRSAGSALMDLGDLDERLALNTEHLELATRLGDISEAFRAQARLIFDCFELGRHAEVTLAIEAAGRLAEELDTPFHLWRAVAFKAMRALWLGRFDEAERLRGEARRIGERTDDPNLVRGLLLQELQHLRLQGRFAELQKLLELVPRTFPGGAGRLMSEVCVASHLAAMGRDDRTLAVLTKDTTDLAIGMGDLSLIDSLAEVAVATRDRELASRALAAFQRRPRGWTSGGMTELTWRAPSQRALGLCELALEHHDEAARHLEAALSACERAGAQSWSGWHRQ
jgi:tetratricopeptide (TPR) repeat protein